MTILLILTLCSLVFSTLFMVLVYKAARIGNTQHGYSPATRREETLKNKQRKNSDPAGLY
jgi:uncharacterized membrane protein